MWIFWFILSLLNGKINEFHCLSSCGHQVPRTQSYLIRCLSYVTYGEFSHSSWEWRVWIFNNCRLILTRLHCFGSPIPWWSEAMLACEWSESLAKHSYQRKTSSAVRLESVIHRLQLQVLTNWPILTPIPSCNSNLYYWGWYFNPLESLSSQV